MERHFTHIDLKVTVSHAIVILCVTSCQVTISSVNYISHTHCCHCITTSVISIQYLILRLYSNACRSTRINFFKCTYVHLCLFHSKCIQYSTNLCNWSATACQDKIKFSINDKISINNCFFLNLLLFNTRNRYEYGWSKYIRLLHNH